jgi:hypothetical protein
MSMPINGVLQIESDENMAVVHKNIVALDKVLQEHFDENMVFMAGEMMRLGNNRVCFSYHIDTDVRGVAPIETALNAIAACVSCTGVAWIEYDPIYGAYHFEFNEQMPEKDRHNWKISYIAKQLEHTARTLREIVFANQQTET